ncbi:MAG: sensor histidine kinase [Paracoccaceae bacterium]
MSAGSLQNMLNALPIPSLAIDGTERIVAANSLCQTLLGTSPIDRNYVTMLRQPALLDAIEACLRDSAPREAQYLSSQVGQDMIYRVSCRVLPGVDSHWAGAVLLTFEDISHLEQAGQMRRDFVANVSHELRTPLTALMGFIETLKGPARGDEAATIRFLDVMQGEAERMNRLVGDLLSLSRVEGEERVRPTEKVNLTDILHSVIRSLRPIAEEANVTIETAFENGHLHMTADADQLTQVFTNLVENAIKYGNSGGQVLVSLQLSNREPVLRAPGVRVEIRDYGAGIDPIHLPRLTERFYRADNHRSRELGGTGLGLAIVKHIINRHRGRLRVDSVLGEGSTFSVILPISQF